MGPGGTFFEIKTPALGWVGAVNVAKDHTIVNSIATGIGKLSYPKFATLPA
jgi:hypothetical protein